MAKSAPNKDAVDALVSKALQTIATADGPVRLAGKGDGVVLFASKAGANAKAIDQLLDADRPLVRVRKEGRAEVVVLTAAGFERVVGDVPEDRVGPAAVEIGKELPLAARVEFLQSVATRVPMSAAALVPLIESAVAEEKAEHAARIERAAQRRANEDACLAAMKRLAEVIEGRRAARVDALRRELAAEGANPDTVSPPPPAVAPKPVRLPETPAEADFGRDVAAQLAAAWQAAVDANDRSPKEYLETAIWNTIGMRMIGNTDAPDERVPFDGRLHTDQECFNGDQVPDNVLIRYWTSTVTNAAYR